MSGLLKNTFVRIAILTFILFFVVMFVILRLENNDILTRANELQARLNEMNEYISELEADIEKPFDEEYISEVAHDKLGMRYPQEVVFYSGESK